MTPFDCDDLCNQPDEFFSGKPMKVDQDVYQVVAKPGANIKNSISKSP